MKKMIKFFFVSMITAFSFLFILTGCNNNEVPSIKCDNCGTIIEEDSKFCPQCGESIVDLPGDDDKTEECEHQWLSASCLSPKICSKCGETKGEALGHTTTTGICERCNERQGWTKEEAQSLIKVYDIFVADIDSADGVDMTIVWENTSSKTIKYIFFLVEAYNAVDDKVPCRIRNSYNFTGELTGPFEPGYTNLIYNSDRDTYVADTVFENCYYNANIRYFKLIDIKVIYMDNTEIEINEDYVEYPFTNVPQGLIYSWNEKYNGYEVNYRLKKECKLTHISIPSKYNGYNVVGIANNGFRNISTLKTISIPDTVRYIGDSAFASCSSLISIELPDSVVEIGESAFMQCDKLISISIPNKITDIKDWTFYGCDLISSIEFSNNLLSIGEYALSNCESLKNITIPNSVSNIDYNAFHDTYIEVASIPNSIIHHIKNDNLKEVTITSGENIDGFSYCKSLTTVNIKSNAVSIASSAFKGCTSLENFTIPNTVTSIDSYAFEDCDSLTIIDIPDNVTNIESFAFRNCDSLRTVRISGDFLSIGSFAFDECTQLTSVTICNGVESIGSYCFSDCSSLESVFISSSVEYIGERAFNSCTQLTIYCESDNALSGWNSDWNYVNYDHGYIYAPVVWGYAQEENTLKFLLSDSKEFYIVTGIGSYTDSDLVIPETYKGKPVKEIGDSAFEYETSITSVLIPDGITKIGDSAFYSCFSITNISIPNSVNYIGDWAFKDCTALTSIFIPKNVNDIGSCAFSGCTNLTCINVDENNNTYKSINNDLYSKDETILFQYSIGKTDETYIIPEGVTRISDYAFLYSINLTSVIIPISVTSIGWDVFNMCTDLTIYCFANDRLAGWDSDWNYCYEHNNGTDYCSVVWGYVPEDIHNHIYTETIIDPTCTEQGYTEYFCECGDSYISNFIESNGHIVIIDEEVKPTCSVSGLTEGKHCSECGKIIIAQEIIPAKHEYVDYICIHCGEHYYTEGLEFTLSDDDQYYSITDYVGKDNNVIIPAVYENKPVKIIHKDAFRGSMITSVRISNNITKIENLAFQGCSSLTEISVDENNNYYTSIDGNLYSKDKKTLMQYAIGKGNTSFTVPNYVVNIEEGAFLGSVNLTNIIISNNVKSIGNATFFGCVNLTEIIIPSSITKISDYAFSGCINLTNITIPESVVNIGVSAFYDCSNLQNIYYTGTETQWEGIEIGSFNTYLSNATIHYNFNDN